jgi:NADH:ubiquinone oxidoreductase subunit F (NADH-binding)/(2Fe-2S) ferredoxin/Pyruvate/2-oxoacid:ferredoxin oxidoreductase delta subunit
METLTALKDIETLKNKLQKEKDARRKAGRTEIVVSVDATCCVLRGSKNVASAFEEEVRKAGLEDKVELRFTGCLGFCEIEPVVLVKDKDILYQKVTPEDVPEILEKTIAAGETIERLLFRDPVTKKRIATRTENPFYGKQLRWILGMNEEIEPISLQDYIAEGGYSAYAQVVQTLKPEEVIEGVKESGLRGRGGGGFPVGRKWESGRHAESEDGIRYVICNADEGDPGAYMDRSVLEGNPHSVIEGMLIGSYAVGAAEGYVYVRAEYPLAVEHLKTALEEAAAAGLLGKNILGTGHDFTIKVVKGAGAFVCGESTALMASIEGKVGRPRAKYVHTVDKGLHERPTVLNNVETWANVSKIFRDGVEAYTKVGTEGSKGTKIFSLVGKINNTGLVEVPMGITLKEIIFDIGGGIPKKRKFKAVQTGGPSGGCLPESMLDLPVDFDELTKAGSMMGSGGMIVLDEDSCMVEFARYFVDFLKGESCGKCVPCREGTLRMLEILSGICEGRGTMEDLDTLEEIGEYLKDTALCALGSTAANPVLTTLNYFRDEYIAHIEEKYCPAGVCKNLFRYEIDPDACTGCEACRKKCPVEAISGEKKEVHVIDLDTCTQCGICYDTCRFGAIKKARVKEVAL